MYRKIAAKYLQANESKALITVRDFMYRLKIPSNLGADPEFTLAYLLAPISLYIEKSDMVYDYVYNILEPRGIELDSVMVEYPPKKAIITKKYIDKYKIPFIRFNEDQLELLVSISTHNKQDFLYHLDSMIDNAEDSNQAVQAIAEFLEPLGWVLRPSINNPEFDITLQSPDGDYTLYGLTNDFEEDDPDYEEYYEENRATREVYLKAPWGWNSFDLESGGFN